MATHPEALLISAILRTKDDTTAAHAGIAATYFHVYPIEWRWIEKYIALHRRTPSKEAFRNQFPEFPLKVVDDVGHFSQAVKETHARLLYMNLVDQGIDFVQAGDLAGACKTLHSGLMHVEHALAGETARMSLVDDSDLLLAEVKGRVAIANDNGGISGIHTGFGFIDDMTGGFQPGQYIIVAARLGNGKTWSLLRMTLEAMRTNKSSLFITLEQPRVQIAFRLHSLLSSKYGKRVFKNTDLSAGHGVSIREYALFLENLKTQGFGDVHILDGTRGRINAQTIAVQIEQIQPDIVFIDYLSQLDQKEKDWQTVGKLSGDLQSLSMRYGIPVVVAAQVNRDGESKEPPYPHQLALSDSIGQDADMIITLKQQSPHVVKFRLGKFRGGEGGGTFYAEFDPSKGVFGEISGQKAADIIEQDQEVD